MKSSIAQLLAVLTALPLSAMGTDRPQGKNCQLAQPPDSAGEEFNHGVTLRIFPRAKDIGSTYTGCQVVWAPDSGKWALISLTEVINGDPVRVWSEDQDDPELLACRFKAGTVVQGNPDRCPVPQFLLLKSLAPGCVRAIKDSVAKHGLGAPRSAECERHE